MKLEIFERNPYVVESIELVSDTGDRFEMSFLKHLLNNELSLVENSDGAYSIFAIPRDKKIAKQLGRIKTSRKHLSDYNLKSPPWKDMK